MTVKQLLFGIPEGWIKQVSADTMKLEIGSLSYDSRKVGRQALFFAVRGAVTDGNLYLDQAMRDGARAVASEEPAPVGFRGGWIRAAPIRSVMSLAACNFFEHPSRRLKLVGITGTNGKTTTAYLVHSILLQQERALLMGTIKTAIGARDVPAQLTTPESIDIQAALQEALQEGCSSGVMEVSSHALHFQRVLGCHFPVAVFTNLSQDHLDFHGNMEEYRRCKSQLFRREQNPGLESAVLNLDDPAVSRLALPEGARAVRFGFSDEADVFPSHYRSSLEGTEVDLNLMGEKVRIHSPLIGRHNLSNLMAAATACRLLDFPLDAIRAGIAALPSVPGRFEKLDLPTPFSVIIDFAHTPDALGNLLHLARSVARARVICVFGCGGDRDRSKRPLMGRVALQNSDFAIITSDNPRTEDPEEIIREIESGVPSGSTSYTCIVSRREAIGRALEMARQNDLVILAGKGHETYQILDTGKVHFDEREVVREALCSI